MQAGDGHLTDQNVANDVCPPEEDVLCLDLKFFELCWQLLHSGQLPGPIGR